MGFLRRIFEGKAIKDGVNGEALVLAINAPTTNASSFQMRAELLVQAPDRGPRKLSSNLYVQRRKWPMPGMTVPVVADRNDPHRVQIVWEEVPERNEAENQRTLNSELKAGRIRARHRIESPLNPDDPSELYELFAAHGEPAGYVIELTNQP